MYENSGGSKISPRWGDQPPPRGHQHMILPNFIKHGVGGASLRPPRSVNGKKYQAECCSITRKNRQTWHPKYRKSIVVSSIVEVTMNKTTLWNPVVVDDWTAERMIIDSNGSLGILKNIYNKSKQKQSGLISISACSDILRGFYHCHLVVMETGVVFVCEWRIIPQP